MRTTIRLLSGRPAPLPYLHTPPDRAPLAGVRVTGPGGLDFRLQSEDVEQLAGWSAALSEAADQLAAAQVNELHERRRLRAVESVAASVAEAADPSPSSRWFWAGPFARSSS